METQPGISGQGSIFDLFKLSTGKANATREVAVLIFDDQRVLQGVGFDDLEFEAGSGGSVQYLISAEAVVDTSTHELDLEQNLWGMWCLQGLSVTLNRAHSLELGTAGLSQIGEATHAGQSSLELR